MIHTSRKITIDDKQCAIDSPIILYRGDREIEVEFTIVGNRYTFHKDGNVIESTNASFGQLVILTPYGGRLFSDITKCEDGKVTLLIKKEMTDDLIEVGFYSMQIRLFDDNRIARITLPPINNGFNIREPIAAEEGSNVVGDAIVDASVIEDAKDYGDVDPFIGNRYNIKRWKAGDGITAPQMNKIERAIDTLNENRIIDERKLDQTMTTNNQQSNDINELKTDMNVVERRINTLTKLEDGSTTGDAELIDGRIGWDGYVYDNIGGAIRKQISDISKNRLDSGVNIFDIEKATVGKYCDVNGVINPNELGFITNYIRVENGDIYRSYGMDFIHGYDNDLNHVSKLSQGGSVFTITNGVKYILGSGSKDELNTAMITRGDKTYDYQPFYTTFKADTANLAYELEKKSLKREYFIDKTIDEDLCTFISSTKNLFDKTKATHGYYVNPHDGKLIANNDFWTSDFIKVEPNTTYTIRFVNQISQYSVKDGVGRFCTGGYSDNLNAASATFTTDENANYVRICGHKSQLNYDQLEKGDEFTYFEEYGYKLNYNLVKEYIESAKTNESNKVKNIISRVFYKDKHTTIKLIGDSITHGMGGEGYQEDGEVIGTFFGREYKRNIHGYCWANLFKEYMEEKFNCEVINNGVSGVSSSVLNQSFDTLVSNTDDIIICMIGTNDRNNETSLTLEANLKEIYRKCKNAGKGIIFMASIPSSVANDAEEGRVFKMEDINHTIAKVCNSLGVEFINIYQDFLDYCFYTNTSVDSLLADGLHPNNKGYLIMYKIICRNLGIAIKQD